MTADRAQAPPVATPAPAGSAPAYVPAAPGWFVATAGALDVPGAEVTLVPVVAWSIADGVASPVTIASAAPTPWAPGEPPILVPPADVQRIKAVFALQPGVREFRHINDVVAVFRQRRGVP